MPTSPAEAFTYKFNEGFEVDRSPKTNGVDVQFPPGHVGPEVAQRVGIAFFEPISWGPNATIYKIATKDRLARL